MLNLNHPRTAPPHSRKKSCTFLNLRDPPNLEIHSLCYVVLEQMCIIFCILLIIFCRKWVVRPRSKNYVSDFIYPDDVVLSSESVSTQSLRQLYANSTQLHVFGIFLQKASFGHLFGHRFSYRSGQTDGQTNGQTDVQKRPDVRKLLNPAQLELISTQSLRHLYAISTQLQDFNHRMSL